MKNTVIILLSVLLPLFMGCSEESGQADDDIQNEFGSLEITTVFEGGETISDVTVSTIPETEVKLTDEFGKALFANIPVGSYQVVITPSFSSVSLTVNATVRENQTESVEVIVGPSPISEIPLDMDLLIDRIYDELKTEFLFDANGYSHYWGDIGMNMVRLNPDSMGRYGNLENYFFSPGDFLIERVWAKHYQVIRLSNMGLDALAESDFTSQNNTDPLVLEAELRFLRALLYFNLVKLYGNPILVTTAEIDFENPPATIQGRVPTYDQIIEDLTIAQLNLPSGLSNEKASSEVATGLLGKVYITMAGFPLGQSEKYALALQELDKLVGVYTLEEEYANVFALDNEGANNEVIFRISYENSGNYGVPWGPLGVAFTDRFLLMPGFINSFFEAGSEPMEPVSFPVDSDDLRFYQNIATFSLQGTDIVEETTFDNWRPYKFVEEPIQAAVSNQGSLDYPYLRMADVYLMIAEAENAVNGPTSKAYDAVNQVRRRAFGNLDNDIAPGLSQQEFLDAILLERRLELCFEGQLKDDFIRNQKLENEILDFNLDFPQMTKDFQSHEYIWPIPQSEMNTNPDAMQNEGY